MSAARDRNEPDRVPTIAGLAHIARMVYEGADRTPFIESLTARIGHDPNDAAAFLDLSTMLHLTGNRDDGLRIQAIALDTCSIYRCVHGNGSGLRVVALFSHGDLMSNTPLDFLFEGSDITVYSVYLANGTRLPDDIPYHDVAYLGVAESDANRSLLNALQTVAATWPVPMLNGRARRIVELSRDHMWELFIGTPDVVAPPNARVTRADLLRIEEDEGRLTEVLQGEQYPIIVRPLDSHAGHGLVRIADPVQLRDYIAASEASEFYIAPYIDYRSADGRFRKYRIVFIAGRPYLAHLAISEHWMVHYLNAGMHESEEKRAEEAQSMERFDYEFGARHRGALGAVAAQTGLEYFAVDCAETTDGRLLLFEAGTGMIVHSMDSADLYPYKQRQMKRTFTAFTAMLHAEAANGRIKAAG